MENILFKYRKLLSLISEEEYQASRCFQGDILEKYKKILLKEREKIEQHINKIETYI